MQEGINILAVNYGAPGACSYPRQRKLVSGNWSFYSRLQLERKTLKPLVYSINCSRVGFISFHLTQCLLLWRSLSEDAYLTY